MKKIIYVLLFGFLLQGCKSEGELPNVELDMKAFYISDNQGIPTLPIEQYRFEKHTQILFVLTLKNLDKKTNILKFVSSQQFDYEILDSSGETVWYWSANKGFAQANSEIILYSEELLDLHSEVLILKPEYNADIPVGKYKVRAWLANGLGNLKEFDLEITQPAS